MLSKLFLLTLFSMNYLEVSTVDVSTENNKIYKYVHDLGIDVTNKNSIIFSVQACNDAHIALSAIKDQDQTDTYEVVIGGWKNKASVIRDNKQGDNKDELGKSLMHPLNCKEGRPFWISWTNGNIKVGTGSYVGDNVFMSWNDPEPHPVNYVAVATGWGSTGQWTFPLAQFSAVDAFTGDNYIYKYVHDLGIDVTNKNSIIFSVQACNDAHIALSAIKDQDNTDTYEVVIGGWKNKASVIRDNKKGDNKDELEKSLMHPLNCKEERPFWISWTNGNIKVGTGSYVGDNVFMSWNDPGPHPVNYVAIATGWGSTGQWTFPLAQFSTLDVFTGNNYIYKYVHGLGIDVINKNSIIFSVQACNDAHIALSAIKDQDNTDTYEVVIGGWKNKASVIRDNKQGDNKDELGKSLRFPLKCKEKRPFWISWTNGNIKVGTGSNVGDNVFMSWNDPGPHPVNYVAVATGWGSTGQWTFPLAQFSTVDVFTGDNKIYKYVHDLSIDVTNKNSIIFSVQACNDAHIALSAIKDQDQTDTYEVVIGGWKNKASVIRDNKQGDNKDELGKSLINPLNCNEKRPFWISWTNGNIKVGTGSTVGDNVFMSWNDPGPHSVNYVAVATGWGSTGQWTFPLAQFPTVDVFTGDNKIYKYVHDLGIDVTNKNSIIFSVQACNDAHIALSAIKDQDQTDTYEVVIGGWKNKASVIRDNKQGDNKDELGKSLMHPLNCKEKRPFWVSWTNGNIKVGTGSYVGDNVFMSWNDPGPHPVNYVAVATGWGSTGQWTFPLGRATV